MDPLRTVGRDFVVGQWLMSVDEIITYLKHLLKVGHFFYNHPSRHNLKKPKSCFM